MPISIKLDLRKVTSRIPRSKALSKAAGAVNDAAEKVDSALDSAASPIVAARVRACTVECPAEVTAIADLPMLDLEPGGGIDVVLLRLRVLRPGGESETCVRQFVPYDVRRVLVPGFQLRARAHESDARFAIVDWNATAHQLGAELGYVVEIIQFDWPDAADWPAAGAIEVRDNWRHRRKIEQRRAEWRSAGARLLDGGTRGARTDSREDWKFELQLDDGRIASVKQRAPDLALARLIAHKPGASKLGGMVTTIDRVVRAGAPIAVLVSPTGDVAIDWEATLRYPELRQPDPL